MTDSSLTLLIFDPGSCQMKKFQSSTDIASLMYLLRNNIRSLKAPQYQILSVRGLITDDQDYEVSSNLPVLANFEDMLKHLFSGYFLHLSVY